MHKRRLIFWVVIGAAAGLTLIYFVVRSPPEPRYQGKRLSEWLADTTGKKPGVLSDASILAVQAIGTNALPSLEKMLQSSDSKLKLRFVSLLSRQHLVRIQYSSTLQKQSAAMQGIRALGPVAKPIFPALVDLVLRSDYSGQAVNALTEAGPEVIALFTNAVANPSPAIQTRAARALAALRQAPEVSVPALIERLKDADPEVRAQSAFALGPYGSLAQAATAALTELSHDRSQRASATAVEALQMIRPNAADQHP